MRDAENKTETVTASQPQKLEALGKLAGGIAHDFNNILSIVEGYANIALKRQREGRLEEDHLLKVIDAARRGAGLTRQLLAFSRQKVQLDQTFDLVELIRQNEVILKPQLGENVKFLFIAPPAPFYIDCASDSITQILLNLASNAKDAMTGGGTFTVILDECKPCDLPPALTSRSQDKRFVRMMVEDTGSGMPPEILSQIFEPFFTTKEQDKGTGLGLSVVYGLVEQMQGVIEVSSAPGNGTRFDLYFPLSDKSFVARPAKECARHGLDILKGKTAVLAEDEWDLRHVLTDMLEEIGLNVLTATGGNEALVRQEDHAGHVDFLITDVMMPGMNGARLAELFLSLRPETKVIFISGYPFLNTEEGFSLPSDVPFLTKPFRADDLALALQGSLCARKTG